MDNQKYYVYILQCNDGSFYTGIAKNLHKRLAVHETGKGSKYVASRKPFLLVYSEVVDSKSDALKREIEIKKMKRQAKKNLIEQSD